MGNKAHIERMLDITPERLVACGFEWNTSADFFIKYYANYSALILDLTNGIFYPQIEQDNPSWSVNLECVALRPITKMHELQALWKVLTGEKLTSNAT